MDIRAYKKDISGLGFRMLACAFIVYGVQIIAQVLALKINEEWASDINNLLAVTMLSQYVVGFPIAFLIMRDGVDMHAIEKRKMKPGHFFIAFAMSYTLLMAGNIIGLIVTYLIGLLKGEAVLNSLDTIVGETNIWVTAIYTVLCAPVFEELLFRKMICNRVIKYGQGMAIMLSGLMFGLFHGNYNQFFYAFFIGCFFAFIYVKTGKIQYTIGLHMMVNFIGSVVGGLFLQHVDFEHLTMSTVIIAMFFVIFVYGIAIAGFVLLLVNLSKLKANEGIIRIAKDRRSEVMIVNAGMILYGLFFIIMMDFQAFFG